MNSRIISHKQKKIPLWLTIVLTALLLISVLSFGEKAYRGWNTDPQQKFEQSEFATLQQSLLAQTDVIDTNWLRTLDPLIKKVEGRLVWSTIMQKGVMEFIDLPKIDKNQKYQLWIFDLEGQDSKPIFSTEFNSVEKGTYLVPFSVKQIVQAPFKFELILKTEGEDKSQPLFLAQP